jgi:hypothetical protein
MAPKARDRQRGATVDLHGHDVKTAIRLAMTRVGDAYNNGYETIELVHGAADVTEPVEEGRGRIKWELRRLAAAGHFDRFALPDKTWLKDASIVLTLRSNPRAQRNSWSDEPPRAFGARGRRW